jgi:lipid II isoglutaminyl synthase (glutamine-hydrolysing)
MSGLDWFAIFVAKISTIGIQLFQLGAGATWPGEIALKLRPNLLKSFAKQPVTMILVAGTNGKTTTVKMLETIIKAQKMKVKHNDSGANLENGLLACLLNNSDWLGKLKSDIYLFEVDEAALTQVLLKLTPKIVVLLDLFRDQLDRYGEVDAIAEKWLIELQKLSPYSKLIINADDPQLAYIGTRQHIPTSYFGLEDDDLYLPKMQHATDTIFCPKCGQRLTFAGVYFSHLGKWTCGKCHLTHPDVSISAKDFDSPLEGVYNKYNTLAAALTAEALNIPDDAIKLALTSFKPAFGRMEEVIYQGKKVKILLSKNPTGFNESIRTILNSFTRGPIMIVLNDRIPDGTDVSWIWDVDFEVLKEHESNELISRISQIIVSGDRSLDMGLRLKYAGLVQSSQITVHGNGVKSKFIIKLSLNEALDTAISVVRENETLWILATYSGMLDVRKIITGKKIL